jgi:hypothetical protein
VCVRLRALPLFLVPEAPPVLKYVEQVVRGSVQMTGVSNDIYWFLK